MQIGVADEAEYIENSLEKSVGEAKGAGRRKVAGEGHQG